MRANFQQLALPRTDLVNMKRNNRRMFHPLEIIMWMASVFAIVCPIKLVHMEKRWDQWPTWCYRSVSRNIHMHNNQVLMNMNMNTSKISLSLSLVHSLSFHFVFYFIVSFFRYLSLHFLLLYVCNALTTKQHQAYQDIFHMYTHNTYPK